ncbi:nuclear transport factor 2 family protein [Massilia alkalitolerans]|uniref:nuclear transport factor 2 family protein n=1 Tax=Massilia alkalitolerans TaxID=286638 RepID=UPI000413E662|nr:nuclear transport factor 2 family protein [Massilia alkalitolerans]
MNTLPNPIAGYVEAANAQAPERLATCFNPDAIVHDEGLVRRGRGEIAAWARDTALRYGATIEPAGLDEAAGRHRLRALVWGNFPGSPITLHFHFELRSGAIQSLEIKP